MHTCFSRSRSHVPFENTCGSALNMQRQTYYRRSRRSSSVLPAEPAFPAILSWGCRDVVSTVGQDGQTTKETRWTTLQLDMHAKSAVLSNGRIEHQGTAGRLRAAVAAIAKPSFTFSPSLAAKVVQQNASLPGPKKNRRRRKMTSNRRSSFADLQRSASKRDYEAAMAKSKAHSTTAMAMAMDAPVVLCIGRVRSPSKGCFIARLRVQLDALRLGQPFELSFQVPDDEDFTSHLTGAAPRWSPLQLTRPKTSSVGFSLNYAALAYQGEEDLTVWVADAERLGGKKARGGARVLMYR